VFGMQLLQKELHIKIMNVIIKYKGAQ